MSDPAATTPRRDLTEAVATLLSRFEISTGERAGCVLYQLGQPTLYWNGERFAPYAKLREIR